MMRRQCRSQMSAAVFRGQTDVAKGKDLGRLLIENNERALRSERRDEFLWKGVKSSVIQSVTPNLV